MSEVNASLITPASFCHSLTDLLMDEEITEILVMGPQKIWSEKRGVFQQSPKPFENLTHYQNFLHQVCDESGIQFNYEQPFVDGQWRNFRVHICSPPVSKETCLTLRRLKETSMSLEQLHKKGWCSERDYKNLKKIVDAKKNIVVVGSTGSGKTTLLNSLVSETLNERCVLIEDTSELLCPNSLSHKLITRKDTQGSLSEIPLSELVKQSLRMRPDRLVVGEVRGGEAKDLLMALSTGHDGSMTSLHASSAAEALLRLEMLVQMGAPQWNLLAIRRLIHLTVDYLIVTKKDIRGWRLGGVYKIASLESFGFAVEELDPDKGSNAILD